MEIIGFAGLVNVFGETHRVWKRRVEAGMPVASDAGLRSGKARTFDSVAVHVWLVEQATGQPGNLIPAQEKAHLDLVSRKLKELDLAEREGRLLDTGLVERVWSNLTGAARQRLLALPNRMASEVAHQEFAVIYSRAEEIVYEALHELHAFKFEDYQ